MALEQAWRGLVILTPQRVDLEPLMLRLLAMEATLRARLKAAHATPPPPPPLPPPATVEVQLAAATASVVRSGSRNLLTRAAYGNPDDLT